MARSIPRGHEVMLLEGPYNGTRIALMAAMHKTITMVDGSQYFRMPDTTVNEEGKPVAQGYLWTMWGLDRAKRMGHQEKFEGME